MDEWVQSKRVETMHLVDSPRGMATSAWRWLGGSNRRAQLMEGTSPKSHACDGRCAWYVSHRCEPSSWLRNPSPFLRPRPRLPAAEKKLPCCDRRMLSPLLLFPRGTFLSFSLVRKEKRDPDPIVEKHGSFPWLSSTLDPDVVGDEGHEVDDRHGGRKRTCHRPRDACTRRADRKVESRGEDGTETDETKGTDGRNENQRNEECEKGGTNAGRPKPCLGKESNRNASKRKIKSERTTNVD